MRADPDVIPDFALPVVTALNHGMRADEHRIPELHGFRMLEYHFGINLQIMTRAAAERAQQYAAHGYIESAFSAAEPGKLSQQLFARTPGAQVGSKVPLPLWVFACLLATECRCDCPSGYRA